MPEPEYRLLNSGLRVLRGLPPGWKVKVLIFPHRNWFQRADLQLLNERGSEGRDRVVCPPVTWAIMLAAWLMIQPTVRKARREARYYGHLPKEFRSDWR
ncbi:MAG: hypothetical protein ACOYD1_07940 [Candidatus Nanopelagicales bacterium]